MTNFFSEQKKALARRSAPEISRDQRVAGAPAATEVARKRAFASMPRDGSEDFEGYPRLPAANPTDPRHPAKTARVDAVESNANSRFKRDGSENFEGFMKNRPPVYPNGGVFHELTTPFGTGDASIRFRFHQENRWWKRIEAGTWGFALYEGDPNSFTYVPLWASDIHALNGKSLSNRAAEADSAWRHTDAKAYAETFAKGYAYAKADVFTKTESDARFSFSNHTHTYVFDHFHYTGYYYWDAVNAVNVWIGPTHVDAGVSSYVRY